MNTESLPSWRGLDPSGFLRSLNLGTDELLHFLALALGTPDAGFG